MLDLLGVGAYHPANTLSLDFIARFAETGKAPAWVAPGSKRRSVLTETELQKFVQLTPKQIWCSAEKPKENATTMGVQASLKAIESAGIPLSRIGLVLAETSTPLETTPGESQRIAGALGLKCNAFDINSGALGFSQFLKVLSNWKAQAIPEYVLCISTHTPTTFCSYLKGNARWILGDAAAAIVVSRAVKGPWRVAEARVESRFTQGVLQNTPLNPFEIPYPWFAGKSLDQNMISQYSPNWQIFPHYDKQALGTSTSKFSNFQEIGFSLGASSMGTFAAKQSELTGRGIIIETDLEQSQGILVLERR